MTSGYAEVQIRNQPAAGNVDKIPVRNIWLLMLYASELLRVSGEHKIVSLEDSHDEIPNLVARILVSAVEARTRRQLSMGYRTHEDWLKRVRGRVDLLATERNLLLQRGMVACRFEQMTIDTTRNRFVRAALNSIAQKIQSDQDLASRCRQLSHKLEQAGVSGVVPPIRELNSDRFGLHDKEDRQMVAAAKLAFELLLPTEEDGDSHLPVPGTDSEFWKLYERAITGFYKFVLEPKGWSVTAHSRFKWPLESQSKRIDELLPHMDRDIVIEDPQRNRRIIIDTKAKSIVKANHHQQARFSRDNIFQMFSYLKSQSVVGNALSETASGILLYPTIGQDFDEFIVTQGHRIRFATVNLSSPAGEIRRRLLSLCYA